MTSDESDDEPLSALAANKKLFPAKYEFPSGLIIEPVQKKRKKKASKKPSLTIRLKKSTIIPPIIERPADVWLYLKDLSQAGPFSCLLCKEWFTNRFKLVAHYILNHKRDFCGICRYHVSDREAWIEHAKFHSPWSCSQCGESFELELELRHHLRESHNLVHCRLCHFRTTEGEEYHTHLAQKHNVTNVACKDEEFLWELDDENFHCYLCVKSNLLTNVFFNHYMGHHHFTLRCFTDQLSGKDVPLTIKGLNISEDFVDTELKLAKTGYPQIDKKTEHNSEEPKVEEPKEEPLTLTDIKEEIHDVDAEVKADVDREIDENDPVKDYKGEQDFDVTAIELVIMEKSYFDYTTKTVEDINANIMPNLDIDYEKGRTKNPVTMLCTICNSSHEKSQAFSTHMFRAHSIRCLSLYNCRVCSTTFEYRTELDTHVSVELKEFEDLWICQFCDKEFDNRDATRTHLVDHLDILELDNCFSPHLGFKCRYCPTLFWNETDREGHQLKIHMDQQSTNYYKCHVCLDMFSEKIWFIHHFMSKHYDQEQPTPFVFKCNLCCITQPSIDNMRSHFNENHPEAKKLFCSWDQCNHKPFSNRKSFGTHIRAIHSLASKSDRERAARCSICEKQFPNAKSRSAHMTSAHNGGRFKCKACDISLNTIDERKLHYLLRHPGFHPHECSECGKTFQYKSTLYMHRQEHNTKKETFTCKYCAKVFVKKDSYREHLQIHEGPMHACSYCPMRFVQRSNMLRHERRHTGERPYSCEHCSRTFADKGACNSHARTHMKLSPYPCMYCGQSFAQKSKLTYHIRKHTGENLETCPICSKLFTSGCSLREHMKTHEIKSNVVNCPICNKRFSHERYMARHLRTLHRTTELLCPICTKTFRSHSSLKQHLFTHAKINAFRCKLCPKSYSANRTLMKHLRKRHGIKQHIADLGDFCERIDPRDLNLDIDPTTLDNIYGPRKTANEVVIADLVAITNKMIEERKKKHQKKVPIVQVTKQTAEVTKAKVKVKAEPKSDTEDSQSLEPTDFVSVKIEPMEEDECQENDE